MKKVEELTTFYIVRHGQTGHNVSDTIQGQSESYLTEKGKEQAAEAGKLLKDIHFDQVFSSDLIRAVHTAEIIVANRQLAINTRKMLRERAWGRYEGRPGREFREENRAIFEKMKSMSEAEKRSLKFIDEYESIDELAARNLTCLRELAVSYPGQTILIGSHAGSMRAILIHLGFGSFDEMHGPSIENAAYIKLESDGVDFFVKETKGINKQ